MKYLCDNCENYPCDDSEVKLMYRCPGFNPIPKPMTNAAKIRAMTDEELAEFLDINVLAEMSNGWKNWLNWLKEEAT